MSGWEKLWREYQDWYEQAQATEKLKWEKSEILNELKKKKYEEYQKHVEGVWEAFEEKMPKPTLDEIVAEEVKKLKGETNDGIELPTAF